jgi:hypothetical protein
VLLLPAAASVSSVVRGLGPFDTPFESSKTAHNSHLLAAAAPDLTRAVQQTELQTPPGDALFATDTSGLAQNYILYSGREVLPIGGYLGNVPAPTLAALRADIASGYVRVFVLPVSPTGPDPRVRWIESHCARQPQPPRPRPVPYANFVCGPATLQRYLRVRGLPAARHQLLAGVKSLRRRVAGLPAGAVLRQLHADGASRRRVGHVRKAVAAHAPHEGDLLPIGRRPGRARTGREQGLRVHPERRRQHGDDCHDNQGYH